MSPPTPHTSPTPASDQPGQPPATGFAFDHPDGAIDALCARISPVELERVPWIEAARRVLGEAVMLDRSSPACDVSAMDGYAVRLADLSPGENPGALPVRGEVQAGAPAGAMPEGAAVRVFTGAMVPEGADAVIPRERVREEAERITPQGGLDVREGWHIRREGENGEAGEVLASPGAVVAPPVLAGIASCGMAHLRVRRRVRVGVLVTGDELLGVGDTPEAWQLRDGNGPALCGLLGALGWVEVLPLRHVEDRPEAIRRAAGELLDGCDALVLTGGVSAGDHDHVPGVLRELGVETVFHKLPIRPGKPVLGGVDGAGRPVFGLPGNPVSVMVTARRIALAGLRARAGCADPRPAPSTVAVSETAAAPGHLTWYPLVKLGKPGEANLVKTMGSGDWVSAASSDGFIEVPAGEPATGTRPLFRWASPD